MFRLARIVIDRVLGPVLPGVDNVPGVVLRHRRKREFHITPPYVRIYVVRPGTAASSRWRAAGDRGAACGSSSLLVAMILAPYADAAPILRYQPPHKSAPEDEIARRTRSSGLFTLSRLTGNLGLRAAFAKLRPQDG